LRWAEKRKPGEKAEFSTRGSGGQPWRGDEPSPTVSKKGDKKGLHDAKARRTGGKRVFPEGKRSAKAFLSWGGRKKKNGRLPRAFPAVGLNFSAQWGGNFPKKRTSGHQNLPLYWKNSSVTNPATWRTGGRVLRGAPAHYVLGGGSTGGMDDRKRSGLGGWEAEVPRVGRCVSEGREKGMAWPRAVHSAMKKPRSTTRSSGKRGSWPGEKGGKSETTRSCPQGQTHPGPYLDSLPAG